MNTSAYHEDGVAAVIAPDLKTAREILAKEDGGSYYKFKGPSLSKPDKVISLINPQVIVKYVGCDC